MSTRWKLALASLAALAATLAMVLVAVATLDWAALSMQRLGREGVAAIDAARVMQTGFTRADAALRAVREAAELDASEAALQQFRAAVAEFEDGMKRLEAVGAPAELRRLSEAWLALARPFVAQQDTTVLPMPETVERARNRLDAMLGEVVAERVAAAGALMRQAVTEREQKVTLLWQTAGLGVAAMLVLIGWAVWSVIRGSAAARLAAERIAAGRLQERVAVGGSDEFGHLLGLLDRLRQDLLARGESEREARTELEREASRAETARSQLVGEIGALRRESDRLLGRLAERAGETLRTADATEREVGGTVELARSGARDADLVSASLGDAAHGVQAMADASRELASVVRRGTDAVAQVTEEAASTGQAVGALAQATGRIGEVAGLIADIAGRTNLLALNATIEAARAGEAGKGFAVVAAEVKALANQTAQATGEISRQIQEIGSGTERSVQAVARIETAIGTLRDLTHEIDRATVATEGEARRIADRLGEVSDAAVRSSETTGRAATACEQAGAAFEVIRVGSREIDAAALALRSGLEGFFTRVGRAA